MSFDLFSQTPLKDLPGTPLAEVLRPENIDQVIGQEKAVQQIRRFLNTQTLPSLIFWGPPGTGKTSLALTLSKELNYHFVSVNAVDTGVKTLKEIGEKARTLRVEQLEKTLLFVDEIHRFNKSQQDVLLPFLEKGDLTMIGATTENPSYEINKALLSRTRIVVFESLSEAALQTIFKSSFLFLLQQGHENSKAILSANETQVCALLKLKLESDFSSALLTPEAMQFVVKKSSGDARRLVQLAQDLFETIIADFKAKPESSVVDYIENYFPINFKNLSFVNEHFPLGYDKTSDLHYDTISAFIKSLRGSDVDSALYYLARMIHSGEDPSFIARRMIIFASEDIGNADPRAISLAVSVGQAVEMIGLPEAGINLAHAVSYLASAPKSNRSYMAYNKAMDYIKSNAQANVPLHLRSSKTIEMKNLGYGKNYQYPHDFERSWVDQNYWPESVGPQVFYEPSDNGFEKNIKQYHSWLRKKN